MNIRSQTWKAALSQRKGMLGLPVRPIAETRPFLRTRSMAEAMPGVEPLHSTTRRAPMPPVISSTDSSVSCPPATSVSKPSSRAFVRRTASSFFVTITCIRRAPPARAAMAAN